MSFTEQESKEAAEVIDACVKELRDLMTTFAVYGGKVAGIDRGDFDVEFFRELQNKCCAIHDRLRSLGDYFPETRVFNFRSHRPRSRDSIHVNKREIRGRLLELFGKDHA
jgi:hypothetical protein